MDQVAHTAATTTGGDTSENPIDTKLRTSHKHWSVSRLPNPLFTGREDTLRGLENLIYASLHNPQPEQCRIVITGIGGQGKSEICLQLVHRLRELFWGIFWVDANTAASASSDFVSIASQIDLTNDKSQDVKQALANRKETWLLVVDNADDPREDYAKYFPIGTSSVILLTSRNPESKCYATAESNHIRLQELADGESTDLLLRVAKIPSSQHEELAEQARLVTSLLHSHPLALIQAGSYISLGCCTIMDYPAIFQTRQKEFITCHTDLAQSPYLNVFTAFEVSVDTILSSTNDRANDALQLLSIMAICAQRPLPRALFGVGWATAQLFWESDVCHDLCQPTLWHRSQLPLLLEVENGEWSDSRLTEAINELERLSLLSIVEFERQSCVTVHSLIHRWAFTSLSEAEQHQAWVTTGCLFSCLRDRSSAPWLTYERQLRPHVEALLSYSMSWIFGPLPQRRVVPILFVCANLLQQMRADRLLSNLLEMLFKHLGLDPENVHPQYPDLYELMARNLIDNGKFRQAVAMREQIIKIKQQRLPEDDPDLLLTEHQLALAYRQNDQPQKAIPLLEHTVEVQGRTLTKDHPSRIKSQHVLALAYRDVGQVEKAISLLEHVVEVNSRTLAEDHPNRLLSQHELTLTYTTNGQHGKAIPLLEHVVEVECRTLAEDHPDRLTSQHVLARTYLDNGQVKEAVSLLEHVVEIRGRTLTENHPHRLLSQHELAAAYKDDGQVEKAIPLLEHVVEVRGRTMAESHPRRLTAQHNLAACYWENGRRDAARQMMQHVFRIRKQVLSEDDSVLRDSADWLEYFGMDSRPS